jgi:hypothetical protein
VYVFQPQSAVPMRLLLSTFKQASVLSIWWKVFRNGQKREGGVGRHFTYRRFWLKIVNWTKMLT